MSICRQSRRELFFQGEYIDLNLTAFTECLTVDFNVLTTQTVIIHTRRCYRNRLKTFLPTTCDQM